MFGKPQISPELLMGLGGGILSGQSLGQGLGQGFQNASNIMTVQRQEQQIKEGENKTRAFVQKMFPNEDVANMPPEVLKMYAGQAIQQRFAKPERAEFKQLDDGTYGAWDGLNFNKLGSAPKPVDLPAIADEYNWMKTQGYKGTAQEYQVWKASQSKSGLMVESDGNGGFRMVQGDVSTLPPKLTESQSKDLNFLGRAKKAEEALAPIENELTSFAQKRLTGLPYDIGNYLQSPQYQQAQQAGREILAIILRKDTGAAVTPQEFETYSKIYLPQPGEDAATIAAKKKSRETAIKGIQDGLGPLAPGDDSQVKQPIPAEEYFKSP